MKNDISVKIDHDNSKEIKAALEKVKDVILEEWGLAAEGFAKKGITNVVYDTPQSPSYKRTGRLRASLTYATKHVESTPGREADAKDGMKKSEVPDENTVIIGTNVEYGPYVEFGTSKMPPRPYLAPAVEDHKEEYKKIMQYHLTQG